MASDNGDAEEEQVADVAAEVFDLVTPEEKAEYERAMALITRVVNRRRAFQNLMNTIKSAKQKFMDEDAIKAGAENGKFYTNAALIMREGLSKNPKVVEALTTAWRCVLVAAHHHAQKRRRSAEMPKVLDHEQYEIMFRKLYLFAKEEQSDAQIDPDECEEALCAEWPRDAEANPASGALELTKRAFFKSWFEMADLYCSSVRASEYASFIERAVRRITTYRPRARLVRGAGNDDDDFKDVQWREDPDALQALGRMVHESNRPLSLAHAHARSERWKADRKRWMDKYGEAAKDAKDANSLRSLLAAQRAAAKLRSSRSDAAAKPKAVAAPVKPYARPTTSRMIGVQATEHRSSPTLVARAPMVSQHRRAPILPPSRSGKSIRNGEGG